MLRAFTKVAFGISCGEHRGVRGRVDRVRGMADDQRGRGDRAALARERRDPAEEDPVDHRGDRARPAGRTCRARCRPRTAPARAGSGASAGARALTVNGRNRAANISGANAMIPASSALLSTGISTIRPFTRPGATTATSSETLAPSDVPPTTACGAPRWSSRRDDLLGPRGHRVDQGVRRAVRASVAEQVERDDVQALGGQRPRQRLVHPARHQLAVQEHHPGVAGAVLGVLQPVAAGVALDEELPNALGDQHVRQSSG